MFILLHLNLTWIWWHITLVSDSPLIRVSEFVEFTSPLEERSTLRWSFKIINPCCSLVTILLSLCSVTLPCIISAQLSVHLKTTDTVPGTVPGLYPASSLLFCPVFTRPFTYGQVGPGGWDHFCGLICPGPGTLFLALSERDFSPHERAAKRRKIKRNLWDQGTRFSKVT